MKNFFIVAGMLVLVARINAQTLTVYNESDILLSDIIFTTRNNKEIMVPLYGKNTIEIPNAALTFKVVSPPTYRHSQTKKYNTRLTTGDIPILRFDDLTFKVYMNGHWMKADKSQLTVEEI
jgi:hypothetical protein